MPSDRPTPIELLAPARDALCARAAIDHGADAVYIGAEDFGARAAACNSDDSIARVVEYARPYGVRVYVTLNNLLRGEEELLRARSLAWRMYRIGVDALIVRDERLASLPGFPPIALHASTQMDNRTAERVARLTDRGYEQVVLARELSLREIDAIHRQVPGAVLEAFVHGAICVSYNGRCRASEVCYGRSADRGECAQFCRMPYDLETAAGETIARRRHLLSMRDMNRTDRLEEMLLAGVRSFKIEGRLKDASYVKNVTAWYRRRLDDIFRRRPEFCPASFGSIELTFLPDPARSFNRGFTDYFLEGRTPDLSNPVTPKSMGERVGFVKEMRRDHIVVAGTASFANGDGLCFVSGAPGSETLVGFRINRAEGNHLYPHRMPEGLRDGMTIYRNYSHAMETALASESARRTVPVLWTLSETPSGFSLSLRLRDIEAIYRWDAPHQEARTDQTASVTDTLSRLGGTPYSTASVTLDMSRPWFIPRSQLSEARRRAIELLGERLRSGSPRTASEPSAAPIPPDLAAAPWAHAPGAPLMECRYCIRYELGECLRDNPLAVKGPLYLRGADGRRFLLRFDCRHCHMMVEESRENDRPVRP